MNIIIRNSDNVVLFSGNTLSVDAYGVHGDGWSYPGLNSSTATLVQNVTLPSPWVPSAYSYSNGTFTVVNQAAVTAAIKEATLQQAQQTFVALMSSGVVLTSTGTPALNGTYATDVNAQQEITSIMTGIADGLGLPGGGSTFGYQDTSGIIHQFDATHFSNLAKAIRDFVYNCDAALATIQAGGTASFPSNQVTIA